jgi:hypothetical protein
MRWAGHASREGVRNGNILFGTYKKETKLGPPGREWEGAYY